MYKIFENEIENIGVLIHRPVLSEGGSNQVRLDKTFKEVDFRYQMHDKECIVFLCFPNKSTTSDVLEDLFWKYFA